VIDDVFGGQAYLRGLLFTPIRSIEADGHDMTYRAFDFSAGTSYADVVVTIAEPAHLSGTILSQRGPAARSGLLYFPTDRAEWEQFRSRSPRFAFVPAKSDGSFTAFSVPGGSYYMVAIPDSSRNSWQDLNFLDAASKVATLVDIDWGQSRTQDFQVQQVAVK